MARDWQALTSSEGFTDVMKLVHLAMRQDTTDEQALRSELLKARRKEYEATLTELAAKQGCSRQGRLTTGSALTRLNDQSKADAASIVNTYNYDLAIAIIAIHEENPKANRHTYARRLQTWEQNRARWKNEQIAAYINMTARSQAQADFIANNGEVEGTAQLVGANPAAEPICQGWLNRGQVPISVALANPSPYHLGCVHSWELSLKKIPKSLCRDLWMGS